MAEEDTRRVLRVFGVTVTNFEEQSGQLLERARQLRATEDAAGTVVLLHDVAAALMDLQRRWLEITNHIAETQRQLLENLVTLANEWPRP